MTVETTRRVWFARRGRRNAPPRVALLGGFGVGNLGNDASLEAGIDIVRRANPDATITCICPRPTELSPSFGVPAIAVRAARPSGRLFSSRLGRFLKLPYRVVDFTRAVRIAKSIDVLLVPGTGILDDYGGEPPKGWPLALATWFSAAKLRRARTGLMSIGAGPLKHPMSRRLARLTGKLADYRSYRDPGSHDFMSKRGVDTMRDAVVPDIVFSRDVDVPEHGGPAEGSLVVMPVMQYGGWYRTAESDSIEQHHIDTLAEFASWLLQSGHRVRLIAADWHDTGTTERVASAVTAMEPERAETALRMASAAGIGQLIENMSDATVVVATRYHSLIGALLCAKPVISLAYAAKNDHMMETVGLGRYCQHLDSIDTELLKKQFSDLVADHDRLSQQIRTRVAEMRERIAAETQHLKLRCGL